ncbi:MAG: type II toxin-antitoxin system HicB family antitoxin [Deltaproteobacteria bacterium]|nr:MAG: type II toxin-antitoxin system HicB family antitoxin [Deltaproteobacteria bacterium]RLB02512.1 MAG: type II toxin-antitoxin system HicB family antitoxin [Deltaproteobacteria bacterium]
MDYTYRIFWSEEDEAYIAEVEELEGCSAFGDTPEQALKEVQTAMQLWLEVAREKGDPIPQPRPRKIAVG